MSIVDINFAEEGNLSLSKMERLLAGIPSGAEKAAKSSAQKASSFLRTNSAKSIQQRYAISAANIRSNERITVTYRYDTGVEVYIRFAGQKIPLYRYDGARPAGPSPDKSRWISLNKDGKKVWVHPSMPAFGHQLKSTAPILFSNAFVARMKSGHVGIFERLGDDRNYKNYITEITGSSVPAMLNAEEVKEGLGEKTMKAFIDQYNHEVIRLLNGWGG